MAGFGRIMKEETNPEIKDSILDFLISLFDDANDFTWDAAKASHAVLLCRVEEGEITSYTVVDKIDRVRRANVQRHHYPPTSMQNLDLRFPRQCPVFNLIKAPVTSLKLMKPKALCTGTVVRLVSPLAKPSTIVKWIAKTN